MNKIFFFIFFIFTFLSQAQEKFINTSAQNAVIQEKDLIKHLEELKSKEYEEAISGLDHLAKRLDQFVEQENLECISEVAYSYVNESGERVTAKKKLSYKERKVCLKKVIEFRLTFLTSKLELRKVLLKKLYDKELKDLEDSFKLSQEELKQALKKYR